MGTPKRQPPDHTAMEAVATRRQPTPGWGQGPKGSEVALPPSPEVRTAILQLPLAGRAGSRAPWASVEGKALRGLRHQLTPLLDCGAQRPPAGGGCDKIAKSSPAPLTGRGICCRIDTNGMYVR